MKAKNNKGAAPFICRTQFGDLEIVTQQYDGPVPAKVLRRFTRHFMRQAEKGRTLSFRMGSLTEPGCLRKHRHPVPITDLKGLGRIKDEGKRIPERGVERSLRCLRESR